MTEKEGAGGAIFAISVLFLMGVLVGVILVFSNLNPIYKVVYNNEMEECVQAHYTKEYCEQQYLDAMQEGEINVR